MDTQQLTIGEVTVETKTRRSKQLMLVVWAQATFLAAAYAVGVWLTVEVHGASVTTPEVVAHGITSSGFATLTGLVGFLAAVLRKRRIALANVFLFALTVVAGATGFSFLGDITNPTVINVTNLSMMIVVGLGMPVSGYSLAVLSGEVRGEEHGMSSASAMIYMALGALSLTIIAGAAVPSASLYATAVAAHVGLAALTVSLVLGVLIVTVLEGSVTDAGTPRWVPQRVGYSLLSLAAVSIAAGDGVIAVTGGGLSYVIVMSEIAVLVYAFLLFAIAAPYHTSLHLVRLFSFGKRLWPRRGEHAA
jgi:hypothetical protein